MSKNKQSYIPRTMMVTPEKNDNKESINLDFTPAVSIEDGIRAGVKDPLWFLSRQWQMGEFEGSNNGHIVKTEIDFEHEQIEKIHTYGQKIEVNNIKREIPLELYIESGKSEDEEIKTEDDIKKVSKYWNNQQLEYQFQCLGMAGSQLSAKEYYGEHLDWYSFTNASVKKPIHSSASLSSPYSVVPTTVQFPGMPKARWWQFEDAHIDLGDLKRVNLNFLSVLLTQFALSYSNDWYTIPLPQPINTIRKIFSIKVTDTFGNEFTINPHENNNVFGFNLFTLDLNNDVPGSISAEKSSEVLLLPNTIVHFQESDSIEEVVFFRDEIANLVWAVERKVYDEGKIINRMDEKPIQQEVAKSKLPVYKLRSPLPENWIPYIPQKIEESTSQIRFRRGKTCVSPADASSPEYTQYKGQILRESTYINEEEIPATPIVISQNYCLVAYGEEKWKLTNLTKKGGTLELDNQRKSTIWLGRKKKRGKKMESSNLRFDYLIE